MKVNISQNQLVKGLTITNGLTKANRQLPVLGNVFLKINKTVLYLQSTDLMSSARIKIDCKSNGEGEYLISASNLLEYLLALNSGDVEIKFDDKKVTISQSGSRASLPLVEIGEYPKVFSFKKSGKAVIKVENLMSALKWGGMAVAEEGNRPALTGVLLKQESKKGKLMIVSSDGFRLSICDLSYEGEWEKDLLIPYKPLMVLIKDIEDKEVEIGFDKKNNQVWIEGKNRQILIRLIQESFPDFRKILPDSMEIKFHIDKDELHQAVKQVSVFARQNANIVKWEIDKKLNISTQDGYVGKGSVELDGKLEGGKITTAFNYRYLQDYLAVVGSGQLTIGFNGPLAPVQFLSDRYGGASHIIMPVKI
jgi:DNA polymerase III subunit beta